MKKLIIILTIIFFSTLVYAGKTIKEAPDGARTGAQMNADSSNLAFPLDDGTHDYYATLSALLDWIELQDLTLTGSIDIGNADTTIAREGAGDLTVEGNHIYRAGGTDVADADVADDITLTNINQITTRPITSLTSSTYKIFYSLGGGAPLELTLGADGTYLRFNGATSAPTAEAIQAGDLPSGIDPDKIGADGTANDKIEAANINIQSMDITAVDSIVWDAGGMSSDGTQCADPTEVTINSGPKMFTIICADNDASTIYGHVVMPDGWDGGTVTFELSAIQTAADTNNLNADISAQCRGSGETVSNTWGTEIAMDTAMTGSNAVDTVTSAAVTPAGTCAAGDNLWWRWQMDATGTDTAVATLHMIGMKMEFTKTIGDE